jgi:cytochrome c oxidase assembly protein subunit 15
MSSAVSPSLRLFTKFLFLSTFFLIFAGAMVTSTGSGLAVPDWPLSYGSLFPPMVGGVFYEHGHRMIASGVGFLTLCLSVWLWKNEQRRWVIHLGFIALLAVILQGVLGGITVKFFLPAPVSVAHGTLAQTFLLLTLFLAYIHSRERFHRRTTSEKYSGKFLRFNILFIILIYIQLIVGASMRHTESGLAIYDFPTMAGQWLPSFDEAMLSRINLWRFEHDLPFITLGQVHIHFLHRIIAGFILAALIYLNFLGLKQANLSPQAKGGLWLLNLCVSFQIILGILTILSLKSPIITSLHVTTGAGVLALAFFLLLRSSPLEWKAFNQAFKNQ